MRSVFASCVVAGRHGVVLRNSVRSSNFNPKGDKRVEAIRQRSSEVVADFNGMFRGVKVCVTVTVSQAAIVGGRLKRACKCPLVDSVSDHR